MSSSRFCSAPSARLCSTISAFRMHLPWPALWSGLQPALDPIHELIGRDRRSVPTWLSILQSPPKVNVICAECKANPGFWHAQTGPT